MLAQIAEKAAGVMRAERFSLFLYDRGRDELFTTAALGLNTEEIRIPSLVGLEYICSHIFSYFRC